MLRAICIFGLLLLGSVGITGCKTRTLEIPESSGAVDTSASRTTPTEERSTETTPGESGTEAADAGPGLAIGATLRATSASWEVDLRAGPLAGASEARSANWTLRLDPTPRTVAEANEE